MRISRSGTTRIAVDRQPTGGRRVSFVSSSSANDRAIEIGPGSPSSPYQAAMATSRASRMTRKKKKPDKALTAHQWVMTHPRAIAHYTGKWVAVTPDGIAANANDFEDVFDIAKQRGAKAPLVFFVSPSTSERRVTSAHA